MSKKVPVASLKNGDVILIGVLGVRLGEAATVTGKWVKVPAGKAVMKLPPRDFYQIERVNGTVLTQPVLFSKNDVNYAPPLKASLENLNLNGMTVVVVESVHYEGLPNNAWRNQQSPLAASRPAGYYSSITLVREEHPKVSSENEGQE